MSIASATHAIFRCPRPSARRSAGLVAAVALALLAATGARAEEAVVPAEAIVVTIPLSSPDSTEQDVAIRYGIEPVERRNSQVLEQRVIVYRIPDGRAPADVVRQVSARHPGHQRPAQCAVRAADRANAGCGRWPAVTGTTTRLPAKQNTVPPLQQARPSRIAAAQRPHRAWR